MNIGRHDACNLIHMRTHRSIQRWLCAAVLPTLLLLAACGNTAMQANVPTPTSAPSAAPSAAATTVPSSAAAAPSAPAVASAAPSVVPTATAAATATSAPEATPTSAPEATPTSAPENVATSTPEATPTAETSTPTAVAAIVTATATPAPSASPGTTADGGAVRPDLSGTLAFVRDNNIYRYQPQTGVVDLLIENGRDMQFSRDGSQLAFVRDDGLYLATADGTNQRQVAALTNVRAPQWTDDATKIVFERNATPTTYGPAATAGELYTIELPDGTARKIADGASPRWAPDGKRLAYVTAPVGELRRNQLRLTNWLGQNNWGVVRALPANTPAIGIPGGQRPAAELEHILFAPIWSADGSAIYVPAFVTSQVETDFAILERADPINGGSTFVRELPGVASATASPDRQAMVFSVPTARGDIALVAQSIDLQPGVDPFAWATTQDVAQHYAPTWSPNSDALATVRCPIEPEQPCDLILLQPTEPPTVLIPGIVVAQPGQYIEGVYLAWRP